MRLDDFVVPYRPDKASFLVTNNHGFTDLDLAVKTETEERVVSHSCCCLSDSLEGEQARHLEVGLLTGSSCKKDVRHMLVSELMFITCTCQAGKHNSRVLGYWLAGLVQHYLVCVMLVGFFLSVDVIKTSAHA